MYVPGTSDDFIFNEEMSVSGPRDHQRIISKITVGLGQLYYREKTISLEPLPETMLDELQASPAPDVILLDNESAEIPVIIEICHTKGLKRDLKKVKLLIEEADCGIVEGFIYNYEMAVWLKYRAGETELAIESSFSEVLQLDLNAFLV